MQQYAKARRRELKLNRLTSSGKKGPLFLFIDQGDRPIQETSEPVVENGAVLEENPDPTAAFDYDDDQGGWFAGFDDDYDYQRGAFSGFDEDYDDDFAVNSTRKGNTLLPKAIHQLEPEIKHESELFETPSFQKQILIDLTLDSDQESESDPGSERSSQNEDMEHGNQDDSEDDSAAASSIADFRDWQAIMAKARHNCDPPIVDDEAYPQAVDILEPKSPLQHVAGRSSSSEIDEADEDEEQGNTFKQIEQVAN